MSDIDPRLAAKLEQGREFRRINFAAWEHRAAENNDKIVEGYATTFDEEYLLYDWGDYRVFESIDPHAFDNCDMADVILQYDHAGHVYARSSNKTLELETDPHGLHVRAHLGGTEIGRQLYEEIDGGYTTKMSFGFVVAEDERTITEDREKNITTVHRKITKIKKLYDVSAVSLPANDATEISARSFLDGVIRAAEEERRAKAEKARKTKILNLLLEV